MTYKTLTVPLTEREWNKLRTIAQSEYRNPKQQAAYLLRCALGLTDPNEHESAGSTLAGDGALVESRQPA